MTSWLKLTFDLYLNATISDIPSHENVFVSFQSKNLGYGPSTFYEVTVNQKSLDSSKRADVCAKSQTISLKAPLRNYIGETRTDSRGTQSAAIIACAETRLEKKEKLSPASEMTRGIFFFFFFVRIEYLQPERDATAEVVLTSSGSAV